MLAASVLGAVCTMLGLLMLQMPRHVALEGILRPWRIIGLAPLVQMPYFRGLTGMDHPGANLGKMLAGAGGYAGVMLMGYAASRFLRRGVAVAVALGLSVIGAIWARLLPWDDLVRPLPLFLGAGLAATTYGLWRRRSRGLPGSELLRWMFGLFGFMLLLKMLLHVRISHYGFVLAMPASLYAIAAMLDWIPQWWMASHPDRGAAWRIMMAAMLVAVAGLHWKTMSGMLARKTFAMGSGGDSLRADASALFLNLFMQQMNQLQKDGTTLAVVPEGAMLNYQLRMANPTPYTNLMPPEMLVFGEGGMVQKFQAAPPDYIALVNKDTSEFGARFFGQDYGRGLAHWIQAHYTGEFLVGEAPFVNPNSFGILLMKRNGLKAD